MRNIFTSLLVVILVVSTLLSLYISIGQPTTSLAQGSAPESPTLTSPPNGSTIGGTSITFQWSAPTGATVYWLEVNTDQNWGAGTRFYYNAMSSNYQTVTGFPNTGTTYYWRVWAGNSSGWSAPTPGWSFLNFTPAPTTPTLTSPPNGSTIGGTSITFQWSAPTGATVYWLEVNTDQNWGPGTRFYYNNVIPNSYQTVTGFPNTGTTYYWRVWAGNSSGWSAPTSGWSLVNLTPPPSTPTLTSPANGSTVGGSAITFQWSASSGATFYWLEVNTDQNWASGTRFYYNNVIPNNYQTVMGFPNNGTTYFWRVWAGNSSGWSAPTSGWSLVNLASTPATPTLISPGNGSTVGGSVITFQWSAPSGATFYWLEVNTDQNWASGTRFYYNNVIPNNYQTVMGFPNNGTTYFWRVWTGNSSGWSAPTSGWSLVNLASTPAIPTLISPGNGSAVAGTSIDFQWTAPSGATFYWLEVNTDRNWGTGTRFYYNNVIPNNYQTVMGFPNNGTTYYWRVWAGNSSGWSAPTSGWTLVNLASTPATPTLISPGNGSAVAGTSIDFQWTAPSGATFYWLEVNTDQSWATGTRFFYASVSTDSKLVTPFPNNGTTYYWRVWAGNSSGWSAPTSAWSVFNGVQCSLPSTPTLISPGNASAVAGTSIDFQWTAPSGATFYWLEVNTDQNWRAGTRFYYSAISGNSQTVTGFPNTSTTYYWRVWAGNSCGWSAPSTGWNLINSTTCSPPATPTLTSPGNGTTAGGSSITFQWSAPSGATQYQLEVNTDQSWGTGTRFFYNTMSSNSQTVTGFPNNGTTYYWRVWAGNSCGWSTPTTGWILFNGTACSPPATPTLVSPGNGTTVGGSSITFQWSAVSGATQYQLEVNTDQNWDTGTRFYYNTMSNNSKTVTGFPNNGNTYYWRVWAGNSCGWSTPTAGWNLVNGTTCSPPATPTLTSPGNGTITGGTSITFQWSAVSGATQYQLEVNTDQNWGTGTRFYYNTMSNNSQTVTGFPNNGNTYYWRVWAGNSCGWSAPTTGWNLINSTTCSPPATPTLTSPCNESRVAGTSITFRWTAVSGATQYRLEVNKDQNWGAGTRFYYNTMSGNSKTVTGFPSNGTTYYWRVWAGNSCGWSAPTTGYRVVNSSQCGH